MGAQWKAKHKDLAANAKGRLFGKLAKDIMIAARARALIRRRIRACGWWSSRRARCRCRKKPWTARSRRAPA